MISIINTGVANIRSLQATFNRLNQPWQLTEDAATIRSAPHVVLPGVGAFAAAIERIDALGIRDAIVQRIADDRPTLCICLGMQLLCDSSLESPGVVGLGIVPSEIRRFSDNVKVPQLGWNRVAPRDACPYYETGEAYFANSFRLDEFPAGWNSAQTEYDGPFTSSLWRGRVLACQFHPELSGEWGQALLESWIKHAG